VPVVLLVPKVVVVPVVSLGLYYPALSSALFKWSTLTMQVTRPLLMSKCWKFAGYICRSLLQVVGYLIPLTQIGIYEYKSIQFILQVQIVILLHHFIGLTLRKSEGGSGR